MLNKSEIKLLDEKIIKQAIVDSLIKLNPVILAKNPVIFIVGVGALLSTFLFIMNLFNGVYSSFNLQIILWL